MKYKIEKGYQNNISLRNSFNELSTKTFGLNFENWFQSGYWKDKFVPYSVIYNNKVIANVSVSHIDFNYLGKEKHYIQLGTVMTDKKFRHQGFSRLLIEKILKRYSSYDGIFLYANDSVLDFYPKFGFKPLDEYRYFTEVSINNEAFIESVPMNTKEDFASFLEEKNKRKSNGIFEMNCDDLLMFYLTQFMKNSVYYINKYDTYVIADIEESTLILYDVFSKIPINMEHIYNAFGKNIKKVLFYFVPKDTSNLKKFKVNEEDTTFFILGDNIENDMKNIKSLPELAHA